MTVNDTNFRRYFSPIFFDGIIRRYYSPIFFDGIIRRYFSPIFFDGIIRRYYSTVLFANIFRQHFLSVFFDNIFRQHFSPWRHSTLFSNIFPEEATTFSTTFFLQHSPYVIRGIFPSYRPSSTIPYFSFVSSTPFTYPSTKSLQYKQTFFS